MLNSQDWLNKLSCIHILDYFAAHENHSAHMCVLIWKDTVYC